MGGSGGVNGSIVRLNVGHSWGAKIIDKENAVKKDLQKQGSRWLIESVKSEKKFSQYSKINAQRILSLQKVGVKMNRTSSIYFLHLNLRLWLNNDKRSFFYWFFMSTYKDLWAYVKTLQNDYWISLQKEKEIHKSMNKVP